MKIKEILHYATSFIFPNRCVICDCVLNFGTGLNNEFICENCTKLIEFIKEPTCKKCGSAIHEDTKVLCDRCESTYNNHKSYYDYGFGLCRYTELVKDSLHNVKYNGRCEYLKFYSKCIAKQFHSKIKGMNIDCFIPVPIHKKRLIERNYNQSYLLSKYLHEYLLDYDINIKVDDKVISRTKNTKVLNKLDDFGRKNELKNAFNVISNNYKSICIIDDIYTTGTTIEAMSKSLKESGIEHIYFIVISVVDNL